MKIVSIGYLKLDKSKEEQREIKTKKKTRIDLGCDDFEKAKLSRERQHFTDSWWKSQEQSGWRQQENNIEMTGAWLSRIRSKKEGGSGHE